MGDMDLLIGVNGSSQDMSDDEPDEMEVLRRQLNDKEKSISAAQKKISEQGEMLAQNNMLLQQVLLQQQMGGQQQQQPQGGQWQQHLQSLQAQGGEGEGEPQYLTVDQAVQLAAEVADQRVNAAYQGLQNQRSVGDQLWKKFQTEKPELLPYKDMVKDLFTNAQGTPEQRYNYAISRVEEYKNAGMVAPPKNDPRITHGIPSAGQQWGPRGTAPGNNDYSGGMTAYGLHQQTDTDLKKDLKAWTEKRYQQWEDRKAGGRAPATGTAGNGRRR